MCSPCCIAEAYSLKLRFSLLDEIELVPSTDLNLVVFGGNSTCPNCELLYPQICFQMDWLLELSFFYIWVHSLISPHPNVLHTG